MKKSVEEQPAPGRKVLHMGLFRFMGLVPNHGYHEMKDEADSHSLDMEEDLFTKHAIQKKSARGNGRRMLYVFCGSVSGAVAEQGLIVLEKDEIDPVDIELFLIDEILHDDIEGIGTVEGKPGTL